MSNQLFIGNVCYDATEKELEDYFLEQGFVAQATIKYDRETGKPRGFGFVTMQSEEDAQTAIEKLNAKEFQGRPLSVKPAKARENKPYGGGGGSGGGQYGGGKYNKDKDKSWSGGKGGEYGGNKRRGGYTDHHHHH